MMLLALLLAAAPAAAGVPVQTQADMNGQAGTDYAAADAAMTVQYRATMAAMRKLDALNEPDARTDPSYRNALLASQRAWLAFRDAECVVEGYQFRGGSAQGMAAVQCKVRLTTERTRQLRAIGR